MRLEEFIQAVELHAPRALAQAWDNPGLLVEPLSKDITRVLVALDCTPEVVLEAAHCGATLILTHHPLFFKPVQRLFHSDPETAAAYMLVQKGIGLYAAHTNLDSALGGVNDALANALGLEEVSALVLADAAHATSPTGIGRVGRLKAPMPLGAFAAFARDTLQAAVRYGGAASMPVVRVAVVGGSGGDYLKEAKAAKADVLLTGEVRHNQALDAAVLGIGVVEAGHYETERVVLAPWICGLQETLSGLQYRVDLMLATSMRAPLLAP